MFPPLLQTPPSWDLPKSSEVPDWYGEIWLRFPLSLKLVPTHFGPVFEARSKFRVIMNEACQVAYSKGSAMTPVKAQTLLRRLQNWFDSLPGILGPARIVLPGHLQLQ